MASSIIAASLHVIPFAILFRVAIGAGFPFDPLNSICFNTETFNSTSNYASYLKTVFHDLRNNAAPSGFATASAGNSKTEKAYGLAFCRGDVSSQDCKACVAQASLEISSRCPENKGAIIWYDYCLLKYTNDDFFGKIDMQNQFSFYNQYDVKYPQYFLNKAISLLRNASRQAYAAPNFFGASVTDIVRDQSTKLFGAVQCSRDLSLADCKKCINGATSEIPNCCTGKEGGRVFGASCNVRYEIYPFFKY